MPFLSFLLAAQTFIAPLTPPEEHYRIDVKYDDAGPTLAGSGTVRVKNTTGRTLARLAVLWKDGRPGGLEVSIGGKPVMLPDTVFEPREIDLPAPLAPGREIEIGFRFARGASKIEAGKDWRFAAWHPRLWWGYDAHASFDVRIDAPKDMVIAASGRLDPASGRWRASHVRNFGIFMGRGYEVEEAMAGATLIRAVYLPPMKECAELLVKTAADVIAFNRARFGFYPQPSLTIMPGMQYLAGGYPFATAMVVVHGQENFKAADLGHWRWITAHEIGHQYWLEHVMEKDPEQGYGWLMIGLGIWMDREWSRERGLSDRHPSRLKAYAGSVRRGYNLTIEIPPEQLKGINYDYNSLATHNKAFGIVSALAAIVGKETFNRIHARCLKDFGGRRLGAADFIRVVEQETGEDFGWFFTPWLRTNGYASLEVLGTEGARVRLRQAGPIRMPVPVEARFEDGKLARRWTSRLHEEQTLEFKSASRIAEVVIDPDKEFPLVIPPPKPGAIAVMSKLMALPWTGAGAEARKVHDDAVKAELDDADAWRRLGMLLYDGRFYDQSLDAFTRSAKIEQPAMWRANAIVWQGLTLDLLGRRDEATARYREALAMGLDRPVRHDQYKMVVDRAFVEGWLKEPFARK